MKILAVRGEGLASLAERFEIDLDAAPLRQAGVFAIVGPTGAGKSTLLDAICLALFDRTPRLPGRGAKIGPEEDERERIASGDPRNLLRKGASRGFAEVDFRGIDGCVYRARWEVRRSRGRSDGRLQESTLTLVDVETGRAIGDHRKTAMLAEIEARLGLSFAQFKRAVLLAQGQFAAFLDADDRERADLLERMTGTEIYGRVSIEVARRAREERAAEDLLAGRLGGVEVLDTAARAELEAQVPAQLLDVARATERTRTLQQQVRWWSDLDLLAREESDARRELADVEGQLDLVEARRREIEEAARAEAVRAPIEASDRADSDLARARDDGARTASDESSARAAERAAIDGETSARATKDAAERALAELGPKVREARELDRALHASSERRGAVLRRAETEAAELAHRREAREVVQVRGAEVERARSAARACREELAVLDAVGDEAPRLIARTERLLESARARAEAQRRRKSAEAGIAERVAGNEAHRAELDGWRTALTEAEGRVTERRELLAREPGMDALRGAAERVAGAREALASGAEAMRRAAEAGARAEAHRGAAGGASESRVLALARWRDADAAVAQLRPARDEAERARDLARATLELADRRADLRDGEECPLCGALDHPHARHGGDAPIARLLQAQEERVLGLRERLADSERAAVRAEGEAEAAARAIEASRAEAGRARVDEEREEQRARALLASKALASLDAWWAGLAAPLRARLVEPARARPAVARGDGEGALRTDGEARPEATGARPAWVEHPLRVAHALTAPRGAVEPALAALDVEPALASVDVEPALAALDGARARIGDAITRREQLERAVVVAEDERDRARLARDGSEAAWRAADAAAESARARVAELARDVARLDAEADELAGRLEPWRDALAWAHGSGSDAHPPIEVLAALQTEALEREGRLALERLARGLERCAAARRDEALAGAELRSIETSLAQASIAVERASEAHALAQRELAAGEAAHLELETRRAEVLALDADVAESDAREGVESARAAHALARAEVERARVALDVAGRARAAAAASHTEAERRLGEARARVARALETAGLDEPAARAALARSPDEIAAWTRDLARLDALRARGRAVLEERARKRERHAGELLVALVPQAGALTSLPGAAGEPSEVAGASAPDPLTPAERAALELKRALAQEELARGVLAAATERVARDDRMREARVVIDAELASQRARVRTWSSLEALIGSSDGKRFRVFAQGLTLELLLDHANVHLERLARRYALRRAPGTELAIQVLDREMGDEIRGIRSLSGGETFLVSLALALALASITARRVRVDSLFIDEGFGGLDAESLEIALSALDALQATGRQVGVISHVAALAERFPARVEVVPRGTAESIVRIVS